MRFLNRHAYIEVAIRNINFCRAIAKTVGLLTGNFLRFGILAGIVFLFLALGTVFITLLVIFIGYYVLEGIADMRNDEYNTIGPLLIIGLIGFFIFRLWTHGLFWFCW